MEKLKAIFGDRALTWDEFDALVSESKELKLANLCEGGYVDKAKFREKEREVEELRRLASDAESAGKLRSELEALKARYDSDISAARLNEAVASAVFESRPRNPAIVRAALDMSSVTYEDGKASGVEEQLQRLKESDPYLFESEASAFSPRVSSGTSHKTSETDYSKLSDEAYYAARMGAN